MNRWIISLLVIILGINVYGTFLQDVDFRQWLPQQEGEKASHRCVDLPEKETFQCLNNVYKAGQADAEDLLLIGQLHLAGLGTEQNLTESAKFFEKSVAEGHNPDAMRFLGDLYVREDLLAAKYWYHRAARMGNLEAQLKLANIYRYGEEKEQDAPKALELYRAASLQGSVEGSYEMALMYGFGIGVEPDLDRTLFILESPCAKGHQESCELKAQIEQLRS